MNFAQEIALKDDIKRKDARIAQLEQENTRLKDAIARGG